MKILDSTKREHAQLLTNQMHMNEMEEDKSISEQSRKHWRHKPYQCDMGGNKNDSNK